MGCGALILLSPDVDKQKKTIMQRKETQTCKAYMYPYLENQVGEYT